MGQEFPREAQESVWAPGSVPMLEDATYYAERHVGVDGTELPKEMAGMVFFSFRPRAECRIKPVNRTACRQNRSNRFKYEKRSARNTVF